MVSLLVDGHLDGHADLRAMRLGTETWREWRDHLNIQFLHCEQAVLDRYAKDDAVWRYPGRGGFWPEGAQSAIAP